jgi:hypothetical protein
MTASPKTIVFEITRFGNLEIAAPSVRAMALHRYFRGIETLAAEAGASTDARVAELALRIIERQTRDVLSAISPTNRRNG